MIDQSTAIVACSKMFPQLGYGQRSSGSRCGCTAKVRVRISTLAEHSTQTGRMQHGNGSHVLHEQSHIKHRLMRIVGCSMDSVGPLSSTRSIAYSRESTSSRSRLSVSSRSTASRRGPRTPIGLALIARESRRSSTVVPGALGECSSARIAVQSECGTRYFPRHGIPVSTDGMSATRVPPSPQARRSSYINSGSWVFALRIDGNFASFFGLPGSQRCVRPKAARRRCGRAPGHAIRAIGSAFASSSTNEGGAASLSQGDAFNPEEWVDGTMGRC